MARLGCGDALDICVEIGDITGWLALLPARLVTELEHGVRGSRVANFDSNVVEITLVSALGKLFTSARFEPQVFSHLINPDAASYSSVDS